MELATAWVTLKLAFLTTLILAVVGVPVAYWMTIRPFRGRFLLESFLMLPMVLPPTVLGFYLLFAMGPNSHLSWLTRLFVDGSLAFTFPGILIGSVICNAPIAIRSFIISFSSVPVRLLEASRCLGESEWHTFRRIALPLSLHGIIGGMTLTFAHTIGEFGVVLMIGGNVPNVTRTLSIAIYDDVQFLKYDSANQSSLILIVVAFLLMSTFHTLDRSRVRT